MDVEAKTTALEELEQVKTKAEEELAAIRASLESLQSGQTDDASKLQGIYAEVCVPPFLSIGI